MPTFLHRSRLSLLVGIVCFGHAKISGADVTPAHFHHVHLNVTDPKTTQQFFERFFGAVPIRYRARLPALFTERSFIVLNRVDSSPRTHHKTCLWHIGWSGVDGPSEFAWRTKAGITVHTPLRALDDDHYMYFSGPEEELVEVYTGNRNHRFEHIHLLATDVNVTTRWFVDHLGLRAARAFVPKPDPETDVNTLRGIWMNSIRVDNLNLVIFGRPPRDKAPFWLPDPLPENFEPTKGSAIDHIAFSYRRIEPQYDRFKASGVTIHRPLQVEKAAGHRSFFVEAPDRLLVEIVEAKPIPEGLWEASPSP